MLVTDEHLPWPDALGRPLAAVDAQALAAFVRARARMNRLDHQKDKP